MNGIVLINKPPGITSFQALETIKRKTGTKKVGHAGTLDRFAQGLLIAAVGDCTRLIRLFTAEDKEYRAVAVFGATTETLDPEGAPAGTGPVPDQAELEGALLQFRGSLRQRPPRYSAVSVGGVRAYRAARAGLHVELAERDIRIDELVLERYLPPRAFLRVVCSKGTYIRALARDIADSLMTCAYLEALTRTRIGGFTVAEAVAPEAFDPERHLVAAEEFIRRLRGVACIGVRPGRERRILTGGSLADDFFTTNPREGMNAVFDGTGRLLAVIERQAMKYTYVVVRENR